LNWIIKQVKKRFGRLGEKKLKLFSVLISKIFKRDFDAMQIGFTLRSRFGHQIIPGSQLLLSSDEFQIWIKIIQNLTEKVKFEIQTCGRIWGSQSNLIKIEGQIWPKRVEFIEFKQKWDILSRKHHFQTEKVPHSVEFGL